jgi:hypothetical protein
MLPLVDTYALRGSGLELSVYMCMPFLTDPDSDDCSTSEAWYINISCSVKLGFKDV